jgi:hypothetical protein
VEGNSELSQLQQERSLAQECPERKQARNEEQIHVNIQEDGSNEDDIN